MNDQKPGSPDLSAEEASRFKALLKSEAVRHGACAARIASPYVPSEALEVLDRWLGLGFHATMEFMEKSRNLLADPRLLMPHLSSVLCVAVPYELSSPDPPDGGQWGYVASFARGEDYHKRVGALLRHLARFCEDHVHGAVTRICVDADHLLERSLAACCGIGKLGRNTSLITEGFGSAVFLGELLLSVDLPPDEPDGEIVSELCRSCRLCVESCPTGALDEPFLLDSRRCLSFWTIEGRGEIPKPVRALVGDRLFGCDTCLSVCPSNRKMASVSSSPSWPGAWVGTSELSGLSNRALRKKLGRSALSRLDMSRLKRNISLLDENSKA